jgi:hypothetical protein
MKESSSHILKEESWIATTVYKWFAPYAFFP